MIAAALHALTQPKMCQLDSKDHDDLFLLIAQKSSFSKDNTKTRFDCTHS